MPTTFKVFVFILIATFGLATPTFSQKWLEKAKEKVTNTVKDPKKAAESLIKGGKEVLTVRGAEAADVTHIRAAKVADLTYTVTLVGDAPVNTADEFAAIFSTTSSSFVGLRVSREIIKTKVGKKEVKTEYIAFGLRVFASQPTAEQLDSIGLDLQDSLSVFRRFNKTGGYLGDYPLNGKAYGLTFADTKAEEAKAKVNAAEAKKAAEAEKVKAASQRATRTTPATPAKPTTVVTDTMKVVEKPVPTPATAPGALEPSKVKGFTLTYKSNGPGKPKGPEPRTVKGSPSKDGDVWKFADGGFTLQILSPTEIKFGAFEKVTFTLQGDGSYAAPPADGRKIVFQ